MWMTTKRDNPKRPELPPPDAVIEGPVRTCVACRSKDGRDDLVRWVAAEDGRVALDARAVRSGRGAWVHPTRKCVSLMVKRHAAERALKLAVVPDLEVGALLTVTVTSASNVVLFTGTPMVNVGGVWMIDATTLPEGTYTVRATARDAAGNTATAGPNTFVVDTTPPAVAITAPADDSITNDNTPALTGTAEAGATVQISVDGAVVGTVTANAGGAWTFTAGAIAGLLAVGVTARWLKVARDA
jgi:predicted RNA-binding protein YlxR (DUF448 family)